VPFNPELGLFRIYGDIRCQPSPDFRDYPTVHMPDPWTSLTVEQMERALREYGTAAARQITATGAKVRIWDLGNEIEFGVAGVAVRPMAGSCEDTEGKNWYRAPDAVDAAIGKMTFLELMRMPESARIAWLERHLWPHEARLLAAVAAGIRTVDAKARFSTHVSGVSSTLPALAGAFFRAMKKGGFAVDELGASYYPTSSAVPKDRLRAFQEMVQALAREFGKPVFVAEFGYPAARMSGVFSWNEAVAGYPQTVEGQAAFVRDLVVWGKREKLLSGIRPWAPDLAMPGWAPMAWFERHGGVATARAAIDALR